MSLDLKPAIPDTNSLRFLSHDGEIQKQPVQKIQSKNFRDFPVKRGVEFGPSS